MAAPVPPAARRMAAVMPPVIPQVGGLVARRPGCLSLAQGMVGWSPPDAVEQALRQLPLPAVNRYGPGLGDPELLEAVRRELEGFRGLDLEGSDVLVTAGSNMAFHAAVTVICDPGDEVILPLPYYFNHVMAVQLAGGVAVPVQAGLIPDPGRLAAAITARTRAIVTISPGNPTGLVTPPAVLAEINRLCARHGLFHISDEAYAEFCHGAVPHRSPGSVRGSGGHTLSLFSLSKAYGMAGWRIGYAAVPRQLIEGLAKVQDTIEICPARPSQRLAVAALAAGPAWCRPRVEGLGKSRRRLLAAVAAAQGAGLPLRLLAEPDGAFYALLEVASELAEGELVERLVLEHGVAVLPGGSFGLPGGPGTAVLRLSYGMVAGAELEEALRRLFEGVRRFMPRAPELPSSPPPPPAPAPRRG